jgi:hypothetical protein
MHKKMQNNSDKSIKRSYHKESVKGFAKDLTEPKSQSQTGKKQA